MLPFEDPDGVQLELTAPPRRRGPPVIRAELRENWPMVGDHSADLNPDPLATVERLVAGQEPAEADLDGFEDV